MITIMLRSWLTLIRTVLFFILAFGVADLATEKENAAQALKHGLIKIVEINRSLFAR